jgi:hypothetical protein
MLALKSHAAVDAANDGGLFVVPVVAVRADTQEFQDGLEVVRGGFGRCVPCVAHQRGGHLCHRQDVVHPAGVDRALRHRRELSGLRILRHAHPTGAANRADASGSVRAAAARENDANRRLVLILGQGCQEEIDRHPNTVVR